MIPSMQCKIRVTHEEETCKMQMRATRKSRGDERCGAWMEMQCRQGPVVPVLQCNDEEEKQGIETCNRDDGIGWDVNWNR